MRRFLLFLFAFSFYTTLSAQDGIVLRARKFKDTGTYGYTNEGTRQGWWAYTVATGNNVEELQCLGEHEWTISPLYSTAAKEFGEGLAGVEHHGKVGFIDAANRYVIAPQFEPCDKLHGFSHGLAPVKVDGKFGYIDKKGRMVIRPQFNEADPFTENYVATVRMNKKYGAIDITGRLIVPCHHLTEETMRYVPIKNKEYNTAAAVAKAAVESGENAAALKSLRATAEEVDARISNAQWRPAAPKVEKAAITGGLYGLKAARTDTAWLVRPLYTAFKALSNGFYLITDKEGSQGVADAWGRILIPARYKAVRYFPQERCFIRTTVMTDGSTRDQIVTESGKTCHPNVVDKIENIKSGKATCLIEGYEGTITSEGIVDDGLVKALLGKAATLEDKEAAQLYYRTLLLRPTSAEAQCNYALIDLSRNNYKEGMSRLKVAHELAPDDREIAACLKEARNDRRKRRWKRVGNTLMITGAVAMTAATTYSAVKGVQSGGTTGAGVPTAGNSGKSGASGSGGKAGMYQTRYNQLADKVSNEARSNAIRDPKTAPSVKKTIRVYQKSMRTQRDLAKKEGVIIPISSWETYVP